MIRIFSLVTLTGSLLLAGCGGSSTSVDNDQGPESVARCDASSMIGNGDGSSTVELCVKVVAGNQRLSCDGQIQSLGTTGAGARLADFRFFVHDLKLVSDEGVAFDVVLDADAEFQNADVALLDFRDKAELDTEGNAIAFCTEDSDQPSPGYNDTVTGTVTVPDGVTISDVRFTLGVPFELNHADQAAAEEPLRSPGLASGMNWSWQNGYKFTGLDVLPVGGVTRPGSDSWFNPKWSVHLGSTGCTQDASALGDGAEQTCTAYNRPVITLPLEGKSLSQIAVQLDYAELVADSNLSIDEGGPAGCMSGATDLECAAVFASFGLAVPDPDAEPGTDSRTTAADTQRVFSIVPK